MNHLRYRTFHRHLKEIFGERVYRISLDAGFTCPNRDGTRAFGGCTFCDDRGSGAPTIDNTLALSEQLNTEMARIKKRFKARKFLAYFQAFSNTYAEVGKLRALYDVALAHPDVVGLCIGTRPDCLGNDVLDLLSEYNERTFLWLEVGLQSSKNDTLALINRGHTAQEFFEAIERLKKRNLNIATHIIFGLPNETPIDMIRTVKDVANIGLDAIKIHQLCVYKNTPMELDLARNRLTLLEEITYVDLVVGALELLPQNMIIMRLIAEGRKEEIVAPDWSFEKDRVLARINETLASRNTWQGKYWTREVLAKKSTGKDY